MPKFDQDTSKSSPSTHPKPSFRFIECGNVSKKYRGGPDRSLSIQSMSKDLQNVINKIVSKRKRKFQKEIELSITGSLRKQKVSKFKDIQTHFNELERTDTEPLYGKERLQTSQ